MMIGLVVTFMEFGHSASRRAARVDGSEGKEKHLWFS
jgi:hypothetical protein